MIVCNTPEIHAEHFNPFLPLFSLSFKVIKYTRILNKLAELVTLRIVKYLIVKSEKQCTRKFEK